MTIINTTNMPAPVALSFNMKMLSVPTPHFIHKIAAMPMRMPANGGTTLRSRRYNPFPSSPVPLGNLGMEPPPLDATFVDIDATPSFYGAYLYINEQVN